MRQAYRIVREKFAATSFTGEGAALTGGRWNSPGTRMVYTSATASLAALETLVHLNPAMLFDYLLIPIEFDERLVASIPFASLPAGWRTQPPPPATKQLGDAWVKSARSAILELPAIKPLLTGMRLQGCTVTADAMHCQQETARFITQDLGGDYIFGLKGNQSGILQRAGLKLSPVFFPSGK